MEDRVKQSAEEAAEDKVNASELVTLRTVGEVGVRDGTGRSDLVIPKRETTDCIPNELVILIENE